MLLLDYKKKKSNEWINEWGNARNEWAGDVTSPTHSKAKKTQIVWKMTLVTASGRCHLLRSSFRAVLGQVQCNYPAVSVDLLYRWICTSFLFSEQFESSSGSVIVQFQSSSGSVSVDLQCRLIRSSLLNLEQFKSSSGSVTGQFQCSFSAVSEQICYWMILWYFYFLFWFLLQFKFNFGAVSVQFQLIFTVEESWQNCQFLLHWNCSESEEIPSTPQVPRRAVKGDQTNRTRTAPKLH